MSYRIINGLYKVWDDEETTFTLPDGNVVQAIIKESGTWISNDGVDFDCLVIPSEKYEVERAVEEDTRVKFAALIPLSEDVQKAEITLILLDLIQELKETGEI